METSSQTTQSTTQDSHYTRSKTGCLTCRVRSKKCDEPGEYRDCEECRKLLLECVKTSGPLSLPTDVKNSRYGQACVAEAKAAVAACRRDNAAFTIRELPLIRGLAHWLSSFSDLQLDGFQHEMSPIVPSPTSGPPVQAAEEDARYPPGPAQSPTAYLETPVEIAYQVPPMSVMGGPSNARDTYTVQAPDSFTSQVIERIRTQVLPMYAETLGVRVEPAGTLQVVPAHPTFANPDPNVPFLHELHHHGSQPGDIIQSLKVALKFAAHAVGLQVLDDNARI